MWPKIARLWWYKSTFFAFVWHFSTVCFQMSPQMICLRRCIVTLVAFVWLLSCACFQICLWSARIGAGIFTLGAFVWLFSTVCFLMCSQIDSPRGCKVTLVALWVFLKLVTWEYAWSHWLHLFDLSPLCVLKWVLK